MKSFRELDVWQKGMDLVDAVYGLVGRLPQDERFALGDQLRRAVVSIPSNIAEGFGRDTHADFAHFLSQARGSLYEVDTQLEIAVRRGWLAASVLPLSLMNDVSKMLGVLARHLRSSPAARGTKHEARGTKHEARGTPHEARLSPHEARGTKHEARGTPHEARI